jgi:hypothetical protein
VGFSWSFLDDDSPFWIQSVCGVTGTRLVLPQVSVLISESHLSLTSSIVTCLVAPAFSAGCPTWAPSGHRVFVFAARVGLAALQ